MILSPSLSPHFLHPLIPCDSEKREGGGGLSQSLGIDARNLGGKNSEQNTQKMQKDMGTGSRRWL